VENATERAVGRGSRQGGVGKEEVLQMKWGNGGCRGKEGIVEKEGAAEGGSE
jgi:hypothetical protein